MLKKWNVIVVAAALMIAAAVSTCLASEETWTKDFAIDKDDLSSSEAVSSIPRCNDVEQR